MRLGVILCACLALASSVDLRAQGAHIRSLKGTQVQHRAGFFFPPLHGMTIPPLDGITIPPLHGITVTVNGAHIDGGAAAAPCTDVQFGKFPFTATQMQCIQRRAESSDTVAAFLASATVVGLGFVQPDKATQTRLLRNPTLRAAVAGRTSLKAVVAEYVAWAAETEKACALSCVNYPYQGALGKEASQLLWVATLTPRSTTLVAQATHGRQLLWQLRDLVGESGARYTAYGVGLLLGAAKATTTAFMFTETTLVVSAPIVALTGETGVGAVVGVGVGLGFGAWVSQSVGNYIDDVYKDVAEHATDDPELRKQFAEGAELGEYFKACYDFGATLGEIPKALGELRVLVSKVKDASNKAAKLESDLGAKWKEINELEAKSGFTKKSQKLREQKNYLTGEVNTAQREEQEAALDTLRQRVKGSAEVGAKLASASGDICKTATKSVNEDFAGTAPTTPTPTPTIQKATPAKAREVCTNIVTANDGCRRNERAWCCAGVSSEHELKPPCKYLGPYGTTDPCPASGTPMRYCCPLTQNPGPLPDGLLATAPQQQSSEKYKLCPCKKPTCNEPVGGGFGVRMASSTDCVNCFASYPCPSGMRCVPGKPSAAQAPSMTFATCV